MFRGCVQHHAGLDHRAGSQEYTMLCNMRVHCFVFQTVDSSYWSNNTFKIFKMERESFKEYSEAATVEKEKL